VLRSTYSNFLPSFLIAILFSLVRFSLPALIALWFTSL
jgi:hypothetical protein